MSLFGKQIQDRIKKDRNSVSEALIQVADSIWNGSRFHAKKSHADDVKTEIARICNYFKLKISEEAPSTENVNDLVDYFTRPLGIVRRRVLLEDMWWKNGEGPLLAVEKETGVIFALIPRRLSGYKYFDSKANRYIKIDASNKEKFEDSAVCFYKPLPMKPLNGKQLISFLLRSITLGDAGIILLANILVTLVGIITPLITQIIFAQVIPTGKYVLLFSAVMLLTTAAVVTYLFTSVKTAVKSRITNHMDIILQNGLIGRVLSLPVKFFSNKSAGELSQSIGALTLLPDILSELFFGTGLMVAVTPLYIIQVAVMSPALSLPALFTFLIEIVLIVICMKQKSSLMRKQLKAEQAWHGFTFALFSGIQKIKLSGSENRAFAKWASIYRKKSASTYNWPFPAFMQNELFIGIQMLGLMSAYSSAISTNVSVSTFAAFTSAFALVIATLQQLSACTDVIAYLEPILEMGEPILEAVPEVSEDKKIVEKLSGAVELSNVSFRYEQDGPNIVDGMNLKIVPGEYVAIVGKSGCGKSTLMRLLLGFETPDVGSIYYGNQDLNALDLASFRRNVGTVLQNAKLFLGDIYSNITISAPWLNMDDAWEAARMAGMEKDIVDMPMGMHTVISEGNGGISGGQRQRLMIARAIAPKPSILMFDEATSALDNITQKIVADSLAKLKCTRIVIAHRLSTIKDCDRIIVLDSGKIVEDGTYDELIAKNGYFADLVSRQQVETVDK